MSIHINAREVLSYLNQLGYTNINASQLQAFIKDLKKLMKYEELKINEPSSNEAKLVTVNIIRESIARSVGESEKSWTDAQYLKKSEENGYHSGYNLPNYLSERPITDPTPSKQKKIDTPRSNYTQLSSKSTIVCPVHFFRGNHSLEFHRPKTANIACNCPTATSSELTNVNNENIKRAKRPVSSTVESKNGTSSNLGSLNDNYKHNINKIKTKTLTGTCKCTHGFTCPCFNSESMRPRSAVIKCNTEYIPTFRKCDPVNLHKYYQRQWKINKIPGEDISAEKRFRWCFRERNSCGPPAKK